MSDKLDKVKEVIKKNIEDAKCGIFFSRNIVGDPTQVLYIDTDNSVEIDICYKYEYFEVFGLTKDEQKEIKNFYCIIKDYDKFDEFGFFNPFAFNDEKMSKKSECKYCKFINEDMPLELDRGREVTEIRYHTKDNDLFYWGHPYRIPLNFCPNCGAKMQ